MDFIRLFRRPDLIKGNIIAVLKDKSKKNC